MGRGRHVNQYYDLTLIYADGKVSEAIRVESTDGSPAKPTVYTADHYFKDVKSIKVEVDKGRTPYPGITGISELEVYKRPLETPIDRSSDGNWASQATAEANSVFSSGYAVERAIDGDTNTDWASKGNDEKKPKVLTFTWDYDIPVKQIEALSRFADPGVDDVKNVECLLYDVQGNTFTGTF